MVFESVVANILNAYLSKFIDDISSSQIKLNAWPGNIELSDLSVKEDAFLSLNLPFHIIRGDIGKLTAIIPWSNFATSRVQLKLCNVNVYVTSSNLYAMNETRTPPSHANSNNARTRYNSGGDSLTFDAMSDAGDEIPILSDVTDPSSDPSWTYLSSSQNDINDKDYYAEIYSSLHSIVSGVMNDVSKKIELEIENLAIHLESSRISSFKLECRHLLLAQPSSEINLLLKGLKLSVHNTDRVCLAVFCANKLDSVIKSGEDFRESKGKVYDLYVANPLLSRQEFHNLSAESIDYKIVKFHNDDADKMIKERDIVIQITLSSLVYVHSNLFYHLLLHHVRDFLHTFKVDVHRSNSQRPTQKPISIILDHNQSEASSSSNKPVKREEKNIWSKEFNTLIETTIRNLKIYLVDDECDCPFLPLCEILLENFYLWQCLNNQKKNGLLFSQISINYYNRIKSGWEPFLESCKFNLNWDMSTIGDGKAASITGVGFDQLARYYRAPPRKCSIEIKASQAINLNLTIALLELYFSSIKFKIIDFLSPSRHDVLMRINESTLQIQKNANDIEIKDKLEQFVLKNETGCRLHFYICKNTTHSSKSSYFSQQKALATQCSNLRWFCVESNDEIPFSFVDLSSGTCYMKDLRHLYQDTCGHKIIIRIDGWRKMLPLSMDCIGRFYREACSDEISNEDTIIVVSILLDKKTARKTIVVRSGLVINNVTNFIVEIFFKESTKSMYILPNENLAVPLPLLYDTMHIRPHNSYFNLSETSIEWERVKYCNELCTQLLQCNPIIKTNQSMTIDNCSDLDLESSMAGSFSSSGFSSGISNSTGSNSITSLADMSMNLYVEVKRENFLDDELKIVTNGTHRTKPAHTISIKSDPDISTVNRDNSIFCKNTTVNNNNIKARVGRANNSAGKYNILSGLPLKRVKPFGRWAPENLNLTFSAPSIGISLIEPTNDELIFANLQDFTVDYVSNSERRLFDLRVKNIQVDNQLFDAEFPTALCFVYSKDDDEDSRERPALKIFAEKPALENMRSTLFTKIHISLRDLILNLEERLVLQLIRFFKTANSSVQDSVNLSKEDESFKFYVALLRIDFARLCLSVISASTLSTNLLNLKRKLGLEFIQFEGANIEFVPYIKRNVFSTFTAAFDSVKRFYMSELKRQAPRIIGAVDFLGNPLGLVNDLTDGLSVLFYQRDVSGLVWNVAHGLSDSTFKFSSVLSHQLGLLTMDQHHHETRIRIRKESSTSGITTGLKKLSVGLAGGMVSLITQAYSGAFNGGVPGFIAGVGKGFVGTVTKPAVGILDFATDTARALRDLTKQETTRRSDNRSRLPRVCTSVEKNLLVPNDPVQAEGQYFFHTNPNIDRDTDEKFSWFGKLNSDFAIIITTRQLVFFRVTSLELDESSEPVCCIKLDSIVGYEVNDDSKSMKLTIDDSRNFTILFDDINTANKILISKANFEEKRHEIVDNNLLTF